MGESLRSVSKKLMGRVLLVEDEKFQSARLKERLEAFGLKCDFASGLQQAKESLDKIPYHAVVLDLFLGTSQPLGLKLVDEVARHRLPLVVTSDHPDLQLFKDAVNHGASYLLEKPFQLEELVEALRKLWEEPRGIEGIIDRFLDNHELTPKEREVARLMLKGLANKELADIEGITDRTVKCHISSIFHKCHVSSRAELFSSVFSS